MVEDVASADAEVIVVGRSQVLEVTSNLVNEFEANFQVR